MLNYHIINTGYFLADGGVMFGAVPKKHWSKKYPVDENNMCILSMRCVFIETGNRRILIDTGVGAKQLSKLKYYQFHQLKNIVEEIRRIGYEPHEVTDVVLSHLHFDHCGASTIFNETGDIVPTFPKATYWVSHKQWNNYRNPSAFEVGAFFAENIESVYENGQIRFVESDMELAPDCRLKLFDGHSPGQIVIFFETENDAFVYAGDVVPTSLNLSLSWLSAFDNCATLAYSEKERLFKIAKKENRTFIFYHDAYVEMK
ncbi:MAG: MBL fold metallo-hydrolase [Dysgonamonadaceae bacterium]|jgi:glyoxylase-like metal-dependent hydrolase (beta-lactamase superfamily II)|nr:MBL fold metallo-hydrolase [Dysgonamonadaceae bacterium]